METYNGFVRTPQDAILLFEACRIGLLPRVQRRLSEKERQQIKCGSVFVWDEREAGMRRWTDGKSWSASRVSGSFLTYREMEGKRGGSSYSTPAPATKRASGKSPDGSQSDQEGEGEGPDGYRYKPDGLMKQSFSITTSGGQHLHLISYFSRHQAPGSSLQQPSHDPSLRHIRPPKNMYPESSVNENTNVPAVTRGPMPAPGYAASPQPMGSPTPYPRPGHTPPQPVVFPTHYGPPTPPYHPQFYVPHPAHLAYQQGAFYYAPGFPPGLTALDRLPPQISNPHAPPAHPGYPPPHPHHYQQAPPQYVPHIPQRAMQATDPNLQHAQMLAQQNAHQHPTVTSIGLPEQGVVLPALNGIGKSTSSQPPEPRPNDTLSVPETNGASQNNASSPSKTTLPGLNKLSNILNDNSVDGSAGVNQSNSRSGSRSPSNVQGPAHGMHLPNISTSAADRNAISKLNSKLLQ